MKEKKTPKEASDLFHNIMGASVKGNPKPTKVPEIDMTKAFAILDHIKAEVEMVVPDWEKECWMQISMDEPYSVLYYIGDECPPSKAAKIEKVILEQVKLIGITAELHD